MTPPKLEHLITREITAFLIDRQARQLSPRTLDFYRSELDHLQRFLSSIHVTKVDEITPDHLRQYLIELSSHRNPGGVHAAYRTLKAYFNWYTFEMDLDPRHNPIRKVMPPKVSHHPLPGIPMPNVRALIATCDRTHIGQRDRAIFYCLVDTGLRKSEFINLNYSNLDLKTGALEVIAGKGLKDRTVFLGSRARRELIRYLRYRPELEPLSPLWTTTSGTRLTASGLRQMVRRRSDLAHIPNPQLHDFRRTFAIESLRNGCDLIRLMHLMGHTETRVLQRYLKLVESDLSNAHDQTSPAENL